MYLYLDLKKTELERTLSQSKWYKPFTLATPLQFVNMVSIISLWQTIVRERGIRWSQMTGIKNFGELKEHVERENGNCKESRTLGISGARGIGWCYLPGINNFRNWRSTSKGMMAIAKNQKLYELVELVESNDGNGQE